MQFSSGARTVDSAPPVGHYRFGSIDSTSLYARRLLESPSTAPTGAFAIRADEQTGGIGRLGRRFHSPLGGLYLTVALPIEPTALDALMATMALRFGLAAFEVVGQQLKAAGLQGGARGRLTLKWPNDLLLDGRKTGGMLTEVVRPLGQLKPWILVGVGINVHNQPPDLLAAHGTETSMLTPATSLRAALGDPAQADRLSIDALADDLISRLPAAIRPPLRTDADVAATVNACLAGVDRPAWVSLPDGHRMHAVVRRVEPSGELLVEPLPQPRTAREENEIAKAEPTTAARPTSPGPVRLASADTIRLL